MLGVPSTEGLAAWRAYLAFESKESAKTNPLRIQILHERALADGFLVPELWIVSAPRPASATRCFETPLLQSYARFALETLKMPGKHLAVVQRALRNCPWSGALWETLLLALERVGKSEQEVVAAAEKAVPVLTPGRRRRACLWCI